jgi:hypothetical protein
LTPILGHNLSFFGDVEGDPLDIENIVIVWSEYKKDDESIASPSVTWNSTAGMWKIIIPGEYITQYGSSWLNLSGTGLIPVAFDIETISQYDYNENVIEGTYSRTEIERMIAAVLFGNEARVLGTSTFTGLDGTTPRIIANLAASGRTVTTKDGDV